MKGTSVLSVESIRRGVAALKRNAVKPVRNGFYFLGVHPVTQRLWEICEVLFFKTEYRRNHRWIREQVLGEMMTNTTTPTHGDDRA